MFAKIETILLVGYGPNQSLEFSFAFPLLAGYRRRRRRCCCWWQKGGY
jgi:hypothetical protein